MTRSPAPNRAADTLREAAERLRAGASGRADEVERIRRAEALQRFAGLVARGPEAVRAALGSVGSTSDGVSAADRERAGRELFALAQRRSEKGMQRQVGVPARPGWELGGHDLPIHRATLREAAEIYELALALHYDSYWDYLRGLLHVSLGEYEAAIRILDHLDGPYAEVGPIQAALCRRRLEGRFDLRTELNTELGRMVGAAGGQAGLAKVLQGAFGALAAGHERAREQAGPAPGADTAPLEDSGLERAERAARDFAESLANGAFDAARSMLSRDLRGVDAEDLRTRYEQMMAIDALDRSGAPPTGETTVMVMTADADMPNLGPHDLGWVYVAIRNERCNEAVMVTVTEEGGEARIRELEWGRP